MALSNAEKDVEDRNSYLPLAGTQNGMATLEDSPAVLIKLMDLNMTQPSSS